MRRFLAVLRAAVLSFGLMAASGAGAVDGPGTFLTKSGARALSIEVADTPREREVGLMFRKTMPTDHGMLFDFGETRPVTMWMKNTFIPLDMVFLDETGRVTHVKERAVPQSLDLISSEGPVRYVVELNAGVAALLGIRRGDRLDHPLIPSGRS